MCGIAGLLHPGAARDSWAGWLDAMARAVAHRGPDDQGIWFDADAGVGLAHRRLSILDLSPEGHQPMASATGRFVLTYNGEIYNYTEVRDALEAEGAAPRWRGHSDTEVILAAIEAWGVEGAVRRFVGIFAFGVWDRQERTLSLARDQLGVKPMYHGIAGGAFVFGSELKALRAHPGFDSTIDRNALALYMRHNYVPAPHTIYSSVSKLSPATVLQARWDETATRYRLEERPFWSAREAAEKGAADPFRGSDADAVDALDSILRRAASSQMMSDVPLGAFLSGGIDSSTVVALMQAQSPRPIRTFSIGFRESEYDESAHARKVAEHLGTDHTQLIVTPEDALAVIPRLPALWDEPFADSSQIPTFLLSELTRRHVTVSLSGDGGDELFCGYSRYATARTIWNVIGFLPGPLRRMFAHALRCIPAQAFAGFVRAAGNCLPETVRKGNPADRFRKLADILSTAGPQALYRDMVSHWREPSSIVLGSHEPCTVLNDPSAWARVPGLEEHMMYADTVSYLPDDILVKVDRASMGVGLEARVPLLDHRVVEFAARVPLSLKVRNGHSKWILRQVLARYVPERLFDRPKMGFGVPLDSWLRAPLRTWAEALLDESRLRREGFFDPAPIRQKWREHLSGERNWHYYLWDVLMFQVWLETTA